MEEVGPVSGRATVGHGARGLQRGRQRLGLLQPRSGPLARVPLGRGRPGRDLRRSAAALLRAGPLERRRSHREGAPVRPHQQRGQSRRGRQGILLLSRQHADPLLHEVPVQVFAGGVPVRLDRRHQSWSRPPRDGIRAARHRRLQRQPVFRRVRGVRQGVARRHPHPAHHYQSRPEARLAAGATDALVPQHVVMGRRGAQARTEATRGPTRHERGGGVARRARRTVPLL